MVEKRENPHSVELYVWSVVTEHCGGQRSLTEHCGVTRSYFSEVPSYRNNKNYTFQTDYVNGIDGR